MKIPGYKITYFKSQPIPDQYYVGAYPEEYMKTKATKKQKNKAKKTLKGKTLLAVKGLV